MYRRPPARPSRNPSLVVREEQKSSTIELQPDHISILTSPCSEDQSASTLILSDLRSCCFSLASRSDDQLLRPKSNYVGPTKNKVQIRGVFFCCENHTSYSPRLPCKPPRSHHQKPPLNTCIFQNTPQKLKQIHQSRDRTTIRNISPSKLIFRHLKTPSLPATSIERSAQHHVRQLRPNRQAAGRHRPHHRRLHQAA